MSDSISQTLSRTVLTALTVFLVALCLFLLGGNVIHDFAFAMLVGLVVGTYSSMYIASPIVLLFSRSRNSSPEGGKNCLLPFFHIHQRINEIGPPSVLRNVHNVTMVTIFAF